MTDIMSSGIKYDPYTRKFIIKKWGYKKYCAICKYNVKSQDEGRGWIGVWCCAEKCIKNDELDI